MQLITGSLPAQYGFRTAGVVDIQTKSGAFENGGDGGNVWRQLRHVRPSFEYGGSQGKLNYFVDGSYDHNDLGIENPTPSHDAIHDTTDQYKTFAYLSYILDDTSRVSFMGSASYSDFQMPNTPGLPVGTTPDGSTPWNFAGSGLPASFNSADLNENQNEQNYYGVVTYQKSAGNLNYQVSAFGREQRRAFHARSDRRPVFQRRGQRRATETLLRRIAGRRQLRTQRQAHASRRLDGAGRIGFRRFDHHRVSTWTPAEIPPARPDHHLWTTTRCTACSRAFICRTNGRFSTKLTLNYGARFDVFNSSFDNENQFSPRVNLIYQPTDSTTLHAGYSRYFTPPPVENVSGASVMQVRQHVERGRHRPGRSGQGRARELFRRRHQQKLAPGLTVGVDGYYKTAKNQLDDGLFGQTLILSAFNYAEGKVYGVEFTGSYTHGGFSTYANVAYRQAQGKDWNSAQFLFDPADLAYVQNHWIYLDHDQHGHRLVRRGLHLEGRRKSQHARLCGRALRQRPAHGRDGLPDGSNHSQRRTVPAYYSINLGAEQSFKVAQQTRLLKARLDVVNVTDNSV